MNQIFIFLLIVYYFLHISFLEITIVILLLSFQSTIIDRMDLTLILNVLGQLSFRNYVFYIQLVDQIRQLTATAYR